MSRSGKVTLADVAAAAGVSAITVSRALRHPEKVSEPARRRISEAISRLRYVPDPAARALASGRTNVIGVIVPSVTNNVFSDVLRGAYGAVEGTPFEIQLGNTRYSPAMEEDILRVFLSQKPAGLVVAGIDQSPAGRALLESADCPVVQIMEIGPNPVDMMVGFSHQAAAAAATRHLIERGYRRLGFVGARMDPRTQRRFQGFRAEAEAAGLYDERQVVTTVDPSTVSLGAALFSHLVSRQVGVDAVFCNNDDLAIGVLFEAHRHRIRVPDELGICGFNDLEMMAAAEPPVTSVRTHRYRMGRDAVGMIRQRLSGEEPPERVRDLSYEVIERQSTRKKSADSPPPVRSRAAST